MIVLYLESFVGHCYYKVSQYKIFSKHSIIKCSQVAWIVTLFM